MLGDAKINVTVHRDAHTQRNTIISQACRQDTVEVIWTQFFIMLCDFRLNICEDTETWNSVFEMCSKVHFMEVLWHLLNNRHILLYNEKSENQQSY